MKTFTVFLSLEVRITNLPTYSKGLILLQLNFELFDFYLTLVFFERFNKYVDQWNESRTPVTNWQWYLFYSKLFARSINTFIPLGNETINSSPVERERSLMDPQPYPLLHFLVRSEHEFVPLCFSRIRPSIRSITTGVMPWWICSGRELYCIDVRPSRKLFRHSFTLSGTCRVRQTQKTCGDELFCAFQHPQPWRNEPDLSVHLRLPPFSLLCEHTLNYAHLQSNKETTVCTCAFPLCMSPTLQMSVSIRNNSVASFCDECVLWRLFDFHVTAPHRDDLLWWQTFLFYENITLREKHMLSVFENKVPRKIWG